MPRRSRKFPMIAALLVAVVVAAQFGGVSAKRDPRINAGARTAIVPQGQYPTASSRVWLRGAAPDTSGSITCFLTQKENVLASKTVKFGKGTRWPVRVVVSAGRADAGRVLSRCLVDARSSDRRAVRARSKTTFRFEMLPDARVRLARIAEKWHELPDGHTPVSSSTIVLHGLTLKSTGRVECALSIDGAPVAGPSEPIKGTRSGRQTFSIDLTNEGMVGPGDVLVTCLADVTNPSSRLRATGSSSLTSVPVGEDEQEQGADEAVVPGTLLPDGTRQPGRRDNGDGTTTVIGAPMTALAATGERLLKGSRFHEAPDGRIQVIHGSTLLPSGVGTLRSDGTRVVGVRENGDGTITVVYPKILASEKSRVSLGSSDRFHDVPGGRHAQLIRGSTVA